jgi:hypothetical protein
MFSRSDGRVMGWEDNKKVQMAGMEIPGFLRSPSFLYCSSRVTACQLWSFHLHSTKSNKDYCRAPHQIEAKSEIA